MKCLNIVSIFPALTETFVVREIRALRRLGCEVVIGELRPAGRRPTATDCEDLRPLVMRASLPTLATVCGIGFFAATKPKRMWEFLRLVFAAYSDPKNLMKLLYIVAASISLAFRLRRAGLSHVRGHHLHSEAVSAMFVSGLLDVSYSFTCHTVKIYYPRRVLQETVRRADFVVANILQVKEFLHSLGATPSQVAIVRNGVSLEPLPARPARVDSIPVVLAVGRLDYKKGFHVLISACAALRDQGVRFRCVIVGEGDERSNLVSRRKAANLEEWVELVGSLDFCEVQRWYERATVLAVPSVVARDGSTDGLPTVIIEAFAHGVPAVGSATAGIPEIIHNGCNGFLVAAGSARELADAIREVLLNRDLRSKLAADARRTVERDFDLDRNARVLAQLMLGAGEPEAATFPLPRALDPASPVR
jgi:colanic acid/amylovoran biosynthesis glycosyltransferase